MGSRTYDVFCTFEYVCGVVTRLYRSSQHTTQSLLPEEITSLPRNERRVSVLLQGQSAKAVLANNIEIGDDIILSLDETRLGNDTGDEDEMTTLYKGVSWGLQLHRSLFLRVGIQLQQFYALDQKLS